MRSRAAALMGAVGKRLTYRRPDETRSVGVSADDLGANSVA